MGRGVDILWHDLFTTSSALSPNGIKLWLIQQWTYNASAMDKGVQWQWQNQWNKQTKRLTSLHLYAPFYRTMSNWEHLHTVNRNRQELRIITILIMVIFKGGTQKIFYFLCAILNAQKMTVFAVLLCPPVSFEISHTGAIRGGDMAYNMV